MSTDSPSAETMLRRIRSSSHTGCTRMFKAVGMNLPIKDATWPSRTSKSTTHTESGFPASVEARAIVDARRRKPSTFPIRLYWK